MSQLIEIKHLTKVYPQANEPLFALKDVNLKVAKGEFLAVMGPSGSGKSTLLNILGCLDRPSSGSYFLAQEEVSRKSEKELARIRNEKIGFIFQNFNLLPRYKLFDNVILPLIYSRKRRPSKKEILQLIEKMGLKERINHRPPQLSGGEQQRVAIARALVNHPEIILADEPTGNLDEKSEREVMAILKQLNQKEGVTLILVTHDPKIAQQAQRIVYLENGRIKNEVP